MNGLQLKWLEKADEQSDQLNDWEQEFVENLMDKPEDYELSLKQNSVLNKIHSKLDGF